MDLTQAVDYATRVARNMTRDPEGDSLANLAAWRAMTSFKPEKKVPLKRWIAICVRTHIHYYWRSRARHPEQQFSQVSEEAWESMHIYTSTGSSELEAKLTAPEEPEELPMTRYDWQLLYENFVDRIPLDSIAKKRGISLKAARALVQSAIELLEQELELGA